MKPRSYHQLFINKLVKRSCITIDEKIYRKHIDIIAMLPILYLNEIPTHVFRKRGENFEIYLNTMYLNNIIAMQNMVMSMNKVPELKKEIIEKHVSLLIAALKDFFDSQYHPDEYQKAIDQEEYWDAITSMTYKAILSIQEDKYKQDILKYSLIGLSETKLPDLSLLNSISTYHLNKSGDVITLSRFFNFFQYRRRASQLILHKTQDGFQWNMLSRMRVATFLNLVALDLPKSSTEQAHIRLQAVWNDLAAEQFSHFAKVSSIKKYGIMSMFKSALPILLTCMLVYFLLGPESFLYHLAVSITLFCISAIVYQGTISSYYERDILPHHRNKYTNADQSEMLNLLHKKYSPKKEIIALTSKHESKVTKLETYLIHHEGMSASVISEHWTYKKVQSKLTHLPTINKADAIRIARANEKLTKKDFDSIKWRDVETGKPYIPPARCYPVQFADTPKYAFITHDAFEDLIQDLSKKKQESLRNNPSSLFKEVSGRGRTGMVGGKLKVFGKNGFGNRRAKCIQVATGDDNEILSGIFKINRKGH